MSLIVALAMGGVAASSIIIRHDQDDAEYLTLGQQFEQVLAHMNLVQFHRVFLAITLSKSPFFAQSKRFCDLHCKKDRRFLH